MSLNLPRRWLEKLANKLPARDIRHPAGSNNARPYLRRFYLGTVCGIRFYLHHFVDSDPDGLHNHPWRFGGSILLAGVYREERRFCRGDMARKVNLVNWVHGDTLHRVVVPPELSGVVFDLDASGYHNYRVTKPWLGVWTLFWHTKKVMTWGTLHPMQDDLSKKLGWSHVYSVEEPEYAITEGHSDWWKIAKTGREVFGDYRS